ncbi:Fav1 protein [Candida orthopsilosis Co 90-125]|uniref:Fav1 protein n=1 Tax=Candida orthopsilosis (strain 90-125) TaxID=1136231 RepID=H8X0K0_CANO9|nr:Fav1 protein [Candida orthopsilosis Co 90-125]CCG21889.1 Fav1 protein [Candida orthopsilosis Co 90-125]
MTEFIRNPPLSERELIGVKNAGVVVRNEIVAEYDPYCPAWLRFTDSESTLESERHIAPDKPTKSKSRKQRNPDVDLRPQISLPMSNPNFNNVQRQPSRRNRGLSKRKPEKLTLEPPKFPLSVHERYRNDGQKSETPKPSFKPPQLPSNSYSKYKKVSSPMRAEFFNHELTNDAKFQYQQQILEFLNYSIGKYKQLEKYLEASKLEWNATSEKSLVLLNLMRIKDGFKDMILSILKQLSKQSGIIDQKEVSETELINCNVFQFVYNCSIEVINFGDLINNSAIFNNLFKFSLLSYYFKLNFILDKAVHHRDQLAIPMEVWYKLPTFIKSIKDQLVKLNNHNTKMGINNGIKRNYQGLEICLVKLNSVTSKFAVVDNLKINYPVLKWTDLNKVDELLKVKVPDYYPQNHFMHDHGGSFQLQFVDFNSRPLSTAVDTNIVNGLHSNYKLDAKAVKRETAPRSKMHPNETQPGRTLSRGASIKRSLSSMVKRGVSTSDSTEKNKPSKLNALTDFFATSIDNQPKQQISRSQTTKTTKPRSPNQQLQATTPPRRNQSLRENKQVLDVTNEDKSPSRQRVPTRSPSKQDILLMLKNRPLPSEPETTTQHKNKQGKQMPNSQVQNYVNCLVQLRKKLSALGPQLIEFLEIQLKYCRLWQRFLEDDTPYTGNHNDPFIKSICQSFHEKLLHQINFTQHTIVRHINSKLIMPIDECLQLYKTVTDLSYIHQFMELIVRQYNKLYCEWLQSLIGAQSIAEYQQLCERMKGYPGMNKGDDIVEYYEQLTKLKNLVV